MFSVLQLGARMHYAVPRILNSAGLLDSLFTDLALGPVAQKLIGRAARRYDPQVRPARVYSYNLLGFAVKRARSRGDLAATRNAEDRILDRIGRDFSRRAARRPITSVYAIDTEARGLFDIASARGIRCVLEQCVAPRSTQLALYRRLADQGIFQTTDEHLAHMAVLHERERAEWRTANRILVPSPYVERELVRAGCAADKVRVVPYGFGSGAAEDLPPRHFDGGRQLRLVFAGAVGPRKGVHDLLAVARELDPLVTFDLYGSGSLDDLGHAVPANVRHHGAVPFPVLRSAFEAADMLFLPSLLEGSATVVYEAMNFGLPGIVTHETGSVLSDGVDGFVVDGGNVAAMKARIERVLADPSLLERLSVAAMATSRRYAIADYRRRLFDALGIDEGKG
jgi:glycosyltransferase involved in cell wall biosynthesis